MIEEERFEVEEASEVWDLAPERVSFEVEDSEEGKRKLRKKVSNWVLFGPKFDRTTFSILDCCECSKVKI